MNGELTFFCVSVLHVSLFKCVLFVFGVGWNWRRRKEDDD